MSTNIISALIAFLGGTAVAVFNSVYTYKSIKKKENSATTSSLLRSVLNVAFLTGTFFLCRKLDCDIAYPLIGAAAGLTIPALIFAFIMAKKLGTEQNGKTAEKEKEGQNGTGI